jgi:hypothetical protein
MKGTKKTRKETRILKNPDRNLKKTPNPTRNPTGSGAIFDPWVRVRVSNSTQ